VQVALEFMNQARVPADRSPESERSFSFPRLEGGRNVDSRSTGNGLQAFREDRGAQYRTPAPRRGSVTSRPYTLQQRAGSGEVRALMCLWHTNSWCATADGGAMCSSNLISLA
jgi:hypothetical protein